MVERAGTDADEHLSRTDLWLGHFGDLNFRGVTTVVKDGGFHVLFSSGRRLDLAY
jgi:hypothetical protein